MLSKENTINLEDFRVVDKSKNIVSKVFTGRDFGEYVREKSNIDTILERYSNLKVIIPENIYSINPSFFEEFLVNIVKKLGKEGFYEKVNFISEGGYNFNKPLNEAIDRILRSNNALE